MKILKFILIGVCISFSACSKTETGSTTVASQELKAVFLENDEIPSIELNMDADSSIMLKVQNRKGIVVTHELGVSPGYDPDLKESFYSMICGKKTLVLVISQEVKSAVSAGPYFDNVLINPEDGKIITTFEAGEVVDRETGEIISDDQKAVIGKLKAGVDKNCPAILQPDDDGTARKLLIGH